MYAPPTQAELIGGATHVKKIERVFSELHDELSQIRNEYPTFHDDAAFVFWFLKAFLTNSEESAREALTGFTADKNIDALYIDDKAKQVHIIQGKYRIKRKSTSEKPNDVMRFAALAEIAHASREIRAEFINNMEPHAAERLRDGVERITRRGYDLRLFYVTTGKVGSNLKDEASHRVRQNPGKPVLSIIDFRSVAQIYNDYSEGVAPAVPTLYLRIGTTGPVSADGVHRRYDSDTKIESFVFSMVASDVGELYRKAGDRLFARNIRGYLGSSKKINEAMARTIKNESSNFWYYNNGVTIVCDEAVQERQSGQDVLRVERAQVINGQQTTRTLEKASSRRASVLVKVIKIPRTAGDQHRYDDIVSSVVRATNWQNYITPSDLISNDHIQVHIERELRKRGYQYLRKRQTKSEARRLFGGHGYIQLSKGELAQAIAACEFDPSLVRQGKEALFDERYYRSIFSTESPSFYLAHFWLMRHVRSISHTSRAFKYAKWLALHFAYRLLKRDLGNAAFERKFRYVSERSRDAALKPLSKALVELFKAVVTFYRKQRGVGPDQKDLPTFFKASGLDIGFEKHWSSSENKGRRGLVAVQLKRFRSIVGDWEMPA
jgi:hypothetical protein